LINRRLFEPKQAPIGSVHVHTADYDYPSGNIAKDLDQIRRFALVVADHIHNDLGRELCKLRGKVWKIAEIAVNLID
jgi:hypothetical protein